MNETNADNLVARFDAHEEVLSYFESEVVLTIRRLAELAPILNLSALAREADINVQTLQAKIRRETPLSQSETESLVRVLKKFYPTA